MIHPKFESEEIELFESINYFYSKPTNDCFSFLNKADYEGVSKFWASSLSDYSADGCIVTDLITNGVIPIAREDDELLVFDTEIGTPFLLKDNCVFYVFDIADDNGAMIFEANIYRKRLMTRLCYEYDFAVPPFQIVSQQIDLLAKKEIPCNVVNVRDLFCEIPEITVKTWHELNNAINNIKRVLPDYDIWFRGQSKEYTSPRDSNVISKLQLPQQFENYPSLVPSLGRMSSLSEDKGEVFNHYSNWMSAFNIWLLSQNSIFKKEYPRKFDEIMGLLYSLNIDYHKYLKNHDNRRGLPDEIEELLDGSEWIYYFSSLCMQQYGMLTSYLDITNDLDTAVYFTHAKYDIHTKKFINNEYIDGIGTRVIYIFAKPYDRGFHFIDHPTLKNQSLTLSWDIEIPLRLSRQNCGILSGSTINRKNIYANWIVCKIVIDCPEIVSNKTSEELFPSQSIDSLFSFLSNGKPSLQGLYG